MKRISRLQLILIATVLGSAVVILDGTIVNLALPAIAKNLHVGFSAQQWVVDGYLLSLSAFMLMGGSLGDILGRKRVYITGLIGFSLMSIACALAFNVASLIITRILQGCFGALLVPGALSIINTSFPKESRAKAIGHWTAWSSIATVLGPLLGGLLLGAGSWRLIFFINIPFLAVCIALAAINIEESRGHHRKVDLPGALLAAVGLGSVSYGLIEGPTAHWTLTSLLTLIVGGILLIIFVLYESRAAEPMIPLGMFRSRNFSVANVMTFLMYGALSGFSFTIVIYLQQKLHYTSLEAGFSTIPVTICMFLFAGRVGGLASKYGARNFMVAGPLCFGLGIASLYFLHPGDNYWFHVLPGVLLFAIGLTLTVAPLTSTVMSSLDDTTSGTASGINNAVSRTAGLLVIAALGLLGVNHAYHFAILLCAAMAILGGLVSIAIKSTGSKRQHKPA